MNKIDKWIYDALKFFSDRTLNEVLEIKRNNLKKYHKKVPKGIEDSLHKEGYISFIKYKDGRDEDSAITTKGLEQLTISLFALAQSFGLISLLISSFQN